MQQEDPLRLRVSSECTRWVAHTQHDCAGMLLERDNAGDRERALVLLDEALATAQELDMKKLVENTFALKLRAQGAEPTSP